MLVQCQNQIGRDEHDQPPGQELLATHPVRQLPERIGRRGIDDIHGHHHQRHQGNGDPALLRSQHQKRFAEPGQREDRAHANDPPIRTVQAFEVFPAYRVAALLANVALRLAHTEQQQGDRKQSRNHGHPEDSPKVVGPQQHQADGQ